MCDGWSNIRNECIINFVITTPKPVFYKSLPTLTQRHTGNYMANVMIDLIEEVGPGKFYGIVTDNAANMKKAWQEINQKYAHITTYGCIAHSLSLLINDIISLESLKDGVAIVNNIRRGHVLHAVFKEKQTELDIKKSLMLPVQTRWGYVVVFLNSLLSNKQIIRLLNIDERSEKDISQRVKQLITNDIFWDKLKNLHNFLKPIAYWITKIESDDPQMSVIPEIFIEIMKQYENCIENVPCLEFEKETIRNKIQLRKVFSVQPIHLAANVLDPKYFGKQLTPEENIDAATFIHKLSKVCVGIDECKVMNDFAQFKVKEGIFSNSYIWNACVESIKPMVWWNAFCSPTELSKLASKILSLPATSAACERTFITYKDIHSSKRNRLTNRRAGKIVYVKHNLKLKEETEKQNTKPSIQRDYFKEFLNSYAENGEDDIQNYDSGDDFILKTERVNEEKNKSTESTKNDSEISETEEVEINELMNLVRRKS